MAVHLRLRPRRGAEALLGMIVQAQEAEVLVHKVRVPVLQVQEVRILLLLHIIAMAVYEVEVGAEAEVVSPARVVQVLVEVVPTPCYAPGDGRCAGACASTTCLRTRGRC